MRKINKLTPCFFLILVYCSAFSQQSVEKIYLKNGSIIEGAIVEQVPNKTLKIIVKGSNDTMTINYRDIERFTREKISTKPHDTLKQSRNKVFTKLHIGSLIHIDKYEEGELALSIGGELGKFVSNKISVGASAYLLSDIGGSSAIIPILGKISYYTINNKKFRLPISMAVGPVLNTTSKTNLEEPYKHVYNSVVINPDITAEFILGKREKWGLTVGVALFHMNYKRFDLTKYTDRSSTGVQFKVGVTL
jgi:hypothetical protein